MAKINKEKQAAMPQRLLKELLEYDGTTGGWVNKTNRGTRARKGQPAGSVGSDGYIQIVIDGYNYKAHRLAWTYVHGDYPDGVQPYIDHINGKKDDNRIANLRVNSSGENQRNKKMTSKNTSGVAGVKRRAKSNNSKKNPKINHYWIANWYNEKGKQCEKYFPVGRYGEEESKQMAIIHRAEQLRLLELNFGIIYSDRHGT